VSIQPSAEPAAVDPDLFRDIDLLCLDAGNTVVFLDHARLSRICREAGFETTTDALIHAEGEAKHAQELGALLEFEWSGSAAPSARAWGAFVATVMVSAGVPRLGVLASVEAAWIEHGRRNLWSLVPNGLVSALDQARAAGVRIAIVSNSEGKLATLLSDVGVVGSVDVVVDSGVVGVHKPDPRIFHIALEHVNVPASRALHLGDIYVTDVVGARSAGLRAALVDPFGHLAGRHLDVPRVPGATAVLRAMTAARR
jgi:putative hydrolase of the HAD superfamily